MKVVIFDDDKRQRQRWSKSLERVVGQGEIAALETDVFVGQVDRLEERRKRARSGGAVSLESLGIDSEFDEVDVVIVDFDLLQAINLSGEEIAYLLRCFSKCGIILALNQFGDNRFDLTLQGHPESFADLNIGEKFLGDPGLWSPNHNDWKEFRPWYWPLLKEQLANHKRRIEDVRRWMKMPILSCLSLDEASAGFLHRKTLEFIQCPGIQDAGQTSFEDFVIHSGKGLSRRDAEGAVEEMKPHIAATRLHHWLESFVLAGQEILVDAPHLVGRYPSLLQGPLEDIDSWNRTATLDQVGRINVEVIQGCKFRYSHWLSRAAWYWSKVRENEDIKEVADPWSVESSDYVFCEDTSRFAPRDKAFEFVADLPSAFNRRYVLRVEPIEYHPSVRFSL